MRFAALLLLPVALIAQPRVDNVLVRMVPPGPTSLIGARMDQVRNSPFYKQLIAQQKLTQLDDFAKETGFDPRTDVREVLYVNTFTGNVLLARGHFAVSHAAQGKAKLIRHGNYNIFSLGDNGYCILDATLAAAGDIKTLTATLDEWKTGKHTNANALMARIQSASPASDFWGVSTGLATFVADHLPQSGHGMDFAKIFRGLDNTWFQVSVANGFKGEIHGTAATEADATRLRDAARGGVGFGRLNVPTDQPEMLKFWDGITAETQGKAIIVQADIPTPLMERAVRMLGGGPRRPQ